MEKAINFQKLTSVNVQFEDLTYVIPQRRKESKVILQSISGQFRSGKLSAILGSSGSGKTSLLNVLSGYKTVGVNGTVMVNGLPVVLKEFLKFSRYIMQETLLQSLLTVQESMVFAAELKLNGQHDEEDPIVVISDILEILRLTNVKDTISDKLSGGERKRLSIALELINNPPVIFLDEPTTGLDEVASFQCISLLKALAERGRTVICSIHTPSARIFEKFDNVYVMSAGLCAYQGNGNNVVTFLSNFGLSCPIHYNPADYVIEVTCGIYGDDHVEKLIKEMENGRNRSYCNESSQELEEITNAEYYDEIISLPWKRRNECFRQFKILLSRRCLQMYRNKKYFLMQLVVYIVIGVFIGSFYFDLGQDASKMLFNVSFCYVIIMQFLYLSIMPIALYFPPEIKLIQREHFNKWYTLTPYYLAMSLATLPIYIIFILFSVGISYTMSDQPMEFDRFILLFLICWLVTLVGDSFGVMMSSIFNVVNGLFMTCTLTCPLIIIACYGLGEEGNLPLVARIAMYCNYVRYAFEGILLAIYGNGRPLMRCPEEAEICWITDSKRIITFIGLQNTSILFHIISLVIWFFIFRIMGFFLLRRRLQTSRPIISII